MLRVEWRAKEPWSWVFTEWLPSGFTQGVRHLFLLLSSTLFLPPSSPVLSHPESLNQQELPGMPAIPGFRQKLDCKTVTWVSSHVWLTFREHSFFFLIDTQPCLVFQSVLSVPAELNSLFSGMFLLAIFHSHLFVGCFFFSYFLFLSCTSCFFYF